MLKLVQSNLIFSSLWGEKSFWGARGINFRIIPLLVDRLSIEHPHCGGGGVGGVGGGLGHWAGRSAGRIWIFQLCTLS
jgi:hypothetical protein